MRKIKTVYLIVLCAIFALGSCLEANSFAPEMSDLNGTWQPDWSYKAALKMPKDEGEYLVCFSWGEGICIPNTTFDIDITTNEPFIDEPGLGRFSITEITQPKNDSIRVNAYRENEHFPGRGWSVEVVFYLIDKDTLWIETNDFNGSEYGKGAVWHRLSGPPQNGAKAN